MQLGRIDKRDEVLSKNKKLPVNNFLERQDLWLLAARWKANSSHASRWEVKKKTIGQNLQTKIVKIVKFQTQRGHN